MPQPAGGLDTLAGQQFFFRCAHGRYPCIALNGEMEGNLDLVVFGSPKWDAPMVNEKGEPANQKRLASQIVEDVRFGSRTDGPGQSLYPYWDIN